VPRTPALYRERTGPRFFLGLGACPDYNGGNDLRLGGVRELRGEEKERCARHTLRGCRGLDAMAIPQYPEPGKSVLFAGGFIKLDVQLGCRLIGLSGESSRKGEQVPVIPREFVSSEDGESFVRRLEELPSLVLDKVATQHGHIVRESFIDNMLVLLNRDHSGQVFLNAPMKASIQVKRAVNAGEVVSRDDIADVRELVFQDIVIPNDVGVMVLFSVGWRKGFYYDLVPLSPEESTRDYDLNQLLGGYYAYLSFQARFGIPAGQWRSLFANGWFPFITLTNRLVEEILAHNREGWNVDDLLPKVQAEVSARLPNALKAWQTVGAFGAHLPFIVKAAEHYENGDHLSCISVLFPRIEGILRSFQVAQGQADKTTQTDLAATVRSSGAHLEGHEFSPLLPLRFCEYLTEVYFAHFDPKQTDNSLSRNTVGHGVATAQNFDAKGATLGFLILDQLSYYFS